MTLIAGNWYTISVNALSAGSTPRPTMSGVLLDAIADAGSLLVYCIDDSLAGGTQAQIAWLGGTSRIEHALASIATTPTIDVTTMDDGDIWTSVRRGDGAWLFWSTQAGEVRALTVPGTLGAFIS